MKPHIQLSIVIPVFNEEGSIIPLVTSIHKALNDKSYELIFIDDCSTVCSIIKYAPLAIDTRVQG